MEWRFSRITKLHVVSKEPKLGTIKKLFVRHCLCRRSSCLHVTSSIVFLDCFKLKLYWALRNCSLFFFFNILNSCELILKHTRHSNYSNQNLKKNVWSDACAVDLELRTLIALAPFIRAPIIFDWCFLPSQSNRGTGEKKKLVRLLYYVGQRSITFISFIPSASLLSLQAKTLHNYGPYWFALQSTDAVVHYLLFKKEIILFLGGNFPHVCDLQSIDLYPAQSSWWAVAGQPISSIDF